MNIRTLVLCTFASMTVVNSLYARHALYTIPYKHLELLAQAKETPNFKEIDGTKNAFIKNIDNKFYMYSQGTRIRCYMNHDQIKKSNNYLGRQIDCFFTTRRKALKPKEIAAITAAVAAALITGPAGVIALSALSGPAFTIAIQPALLVGGLFYGTGGAITYALGPVLGINFAATAATATAFGSTAIGAATGAFASAATPLLVSASAAAGITLAHKSVALLVNGLNGSKITFDKIATAVGLSLSSGLAGAAFSSVAAELSGLAHTAASESSGIALSKEKEEELKKKYEKGGADYMNYYIGKVTTLSAIARFNLAEFGKGDLFVQYRLPGDRASKNRYYINRTLAHYKMPQDKKVAKNSWEGLYRSDFSHCYKKTKCENLKKTSEKNLCTFIQKVCKSSSLQYCWTTDSFFKVISPLGNKKDRVFLPDGVEVYATKSYAKLLSKQKVGG